MLQATVANAATPMLAAPPSETFTPIALRGYGTLSGSLWTLPTGSVLQIDCEDADKAKLAHAKYLSDLQVLPGVTLKKLGADSVCEIESQGVIAAYFDGTRVAILAAKSDADLQTLITQVKPTGATTAQVTVPMWLDRWDKYSFRHYYSPFTTPKGVKMTDYDFSSDFDWAEKEDHAGVLVSEFRLATDTADEMLNTGYNDWVIDEAARHNLPVDIHLGAGAGGDPTWFINRFRDQMQEKVPGFTGEFYSLANPYLGGQGVVAWCAKAAWDDILGLLQQSVKRYANAPNVTSFLEPHSELHHGAQDILLEFGPVADQRYREILKDKYKTVGELAARWDRPLKSWDDVHVPELDSFAGWGPDAFDIGGGMYKVGYETLDAPYKAPEGARDALKSTPAPNEWYKPDFDDSKWPDVPGAGNDKELFLQRRPAVFRRHFELPAAWKAKHPKVYLYEWDLNIATKERVRVELNGNTVGNDEIAFNTLHWSAVDVTSAVKEGKNVLAIRTPQGYLGYRVYLSSVEPRQYPNLDRGLNAQWSDFVDFTQWYHIDAVRRGMQMIRQVAPNQGITLMHPDEYSDGVKSMAVAYGGEFHNTGYMGAFYADYNTTLMRGADLPYSIEPGSPAAKFVDWKHQWGLYQTEGVQAVDYFVKMGDILWNPEMKADYEAHRKQISLMGQSHIPKAQTAMLFSDRVTTLLSFPWSPTSDSNLFSGYWHWNIGTVLRGYYPYDGLSQSSFANGEATPYRVVFDSNTSVMDKPMLADIEKWIRAGGTFVTVGQTGRSTSDQPDCWPIAELTGYKVVHIDRLNAKGDAEEKTTLKPAPGQTLYGPSWAGVAANGLHLQPVASDVQNLLLWNDGSVAAGVRPLGKGYIVDLGAKFTGLTLPDRLEPREDSKDDDTKPEVVHLRDLASAILKWRNVAPEPCHLATPNTEILMRHNVTNNGLYDTWTVWNQSKDQSTKVSIELNQQQAPAFVIDMKDEKPVSSLKDIELQPLETRVFMTPKEQLLQAPLAWFDLQRKWWRGTTPPGDTKLPIPSTKLAVDLTYDWKFTTIPVGAEAESLVSGRADGGKWSTREIGVWDVKELGGGHGVFRKQFTVPATWSKGRVSMWMISWEGSSFLDQGRVWLDGKLVKGMSETGYIAEDSKTLTAGSSHELAVEVDSKGSLAGLRGKCWISFEPQPDSGIDLAGEWTPSSDGLQYGNPITLPGKFDGRFFKRTISVSSEYKTDTVYITIDGDPSIICALINGKLVRRHHHMIGERASMNITPYIKFGQPNDIELIRWNGPGKGELKNLFLGFFKENPAAE